MFQAQAAGQRELARRTPNGRGFARQQGLVKGGVVIKQERVCGQVLAYRHTHYVTFAQLGQGYVFTAAVGGFAAGKRRTRAGQSIHLAAGPGARTLLEHSRQQQQKNKHYRSVEPDLSAATQGLEQAGKIGEQGRTCDQGVHAEATQAQLA